MDFPSDNFKLNDSFTSQSSSNKSLKNNTKDADNSFSLNHNKDNDNSSTVQFKPENYDICNSCFVYCESRFKYYINDNDNCVNKTEKLARCCNYYNKNCLQSKSKNAILTNQYKNICDHNIINSNISINSLYINNCICLDMPDKCEISLNNISNNNYCNKKLIYNSYIKKKDIEFNWSLKLGNTLFLKHQLILKKLIEKEKYKKCMLFNKR